MEKSFAIGRWLLFLLLAALLVCITAVVVVDAKKNPEQPNVLWLKAYVHSVEGPCVSHDGQHSILFLKDKEGVLWGSVPLSFAKAGDEIMVLKDVHGKYWLRKTDDQKLYDPPPE